MAIETLKQVYFLSQILYFAGILLAFASVATMILSERVARMGWRTAWMSGYCMALISASAFVFPAKAEFINGVEHFDGTTKDLATWEQYGATFTQNDALTIGGFGNYADYTTKTGILSVGQRVTAEVTLSIPPDAPLSSFEAALLLTTNSAGMASDTFGDSRFFGPQIHFDTESGQLTSALQSISGGNNGYGFKTYALGVPVSGAELVLSVARYSVTDVSSSASFPNGTLIFDDSFTAFAPIPNTGLNVALHRTSLGGFQSTATFDNVTITSVPEPLFGAMLFSISLVRWSMRSRTKRNASDCEYHDWNRAGMGRTQLWAGERSNGVSPW